MYLSGQCWGRDMEIHRCLVWPSCVCMDSRLELFWRQPYQSPSKTNVTVHIWACSGWSPLRATTTHSLLLNFSGFSPVLAVTHQLTSYSYCWHILSCTPFPPLPNSFGNNDVNMLYGRKLKQKGKNQLYDKQRNKTVIGSAGRYIPCGF